MPGCSLELTNHFHYHSVHIRSLVVASIFISSSLHLGLPAAFAVRMLKEISDGLVVILIVPHQVVTSTPSSTIRWMVVRHSLSCHTYQLP